MLEYEFETIAADRGFVVGKTIGHREAILRRAAEGWRYAGFVPAKQRAGGFIESIDLIFERETGDKP